jgi:HD-GYP domain-containing protein (c-di-GMP phosphodiesterase class II)
MPMLRPLIESGREAQLTGSWDEALAHFQAALDCPDCESLPGARPDIMRWVGEVHRERGELDAATDWTTRSRAEADAEGLIDRIASALNSLGIIATMRGDLEDGARLFMDARAIAESLGDGQIVAMADQNLGTIANIRGNPNSALMSYRSALTKYQQLKDTLRATRALHNMGMAHVDLNELEAADRSFREAAKLASTSGERMMVGRVELYRAAVHLRRSRYEDAFASIATSLEIFTGLKVRPSIAEAYKLYGVLYAKTGKPRQAHTHLGLALDIARSCENRLLQAEIHLEWSLLHLTESRREEGILNMNRALSIFSELRNRPTATVERQLEGVRELYFPAVQAWGARHRQDEDRFQLGHSQRVAEYATQLAAKAGAEGWDLMWIRIGALIHDLGGEMELGDVPEEAVESPERGTGVARLRAMVGTCMAKRMEFPQDIVRIVRHHRERWDGRGVPDQLAGSDIPLGARAVAIAKAYDSLVTPRRFMSACSPAQALDVLNEEAGGRFDPELWEHFRELMGEAPNVYIAPPLSN